MSKNVQDHAHSLTFHARKQKYLVIQNERLVNFQNHQRDFEYTTLISSVHYSIKGKHLLFNLHRQIHKLGWNHYTILNNITTENVAKEFYNNWISRFGTSSRLIIYRRAQFCSEIFQDFSWLCGIKQLHTTASVKWQVATAPQIN